MSFEYVRKTYNVPVKRGLPVHIKAWGSWIDGTITSCDHCVVVKPDIFTNKRLRYYPTDYSNINYSNCSKQTEAKK